MIGFSGIVGPRREKLSQNEGAANTTLNEIAQEMRARGGAGKSLNDNLDELKYEAKRVKDELGQLRSGPAIQPDRAISDMEAIRDGFNASLQDIFVEVARGALKLDSRRTIASVAVLTQHLNEIAEHLDALQRRMPERSSRAEAQKGQPRLDEVAFDLSTVFKGQKETQQVNVAAQLDARDEGRNRLWALSVSFKGFRYAIEHGTILQNGPFDFEEISRVSGTELSKRLARRVLVLAEAAKWDQSDGRQYCYTSRSGGQFLVEVGVETLLKSLDYQALRSLEEAIAGMSGPTISFNRRSLTIPEVLTLQDSSNRPPNPECKTLINWLQELSVKICDPARNGNEVAKQMLNAELGANDKLELAGHAVRNTIPTAILSLHTIGEGLDIDSQRVSFGLEQGITTLVAALKDRIASLEVGELVMDTGVGKSAAKLARKRARAGTEPGPVSDVNSNYSIIIERASVIAGATGLRECLAGAGCDLSDLNNIGVRTIVKMLGFSDRDSFANVTGESIVSDLISAGLINADEYGLDLIRALPNGETDNRTVVAARIFCGWAQAAWLLNTFVRCSWEGNLDRTKRPNFATFDGMIRNISETVASDQPKLRDLRVVLEILKDCAQLPMVLEAQ